MSYDVIENIKNKITHKWGFWDNVEIYWCRYFWNYVERCYYNVKYGIRNLIRYLPVIWRNREYDDYFLIQIIRTKLVYMSKEAETKWMSVDAKKHAKQMQRCIELIDILYDDDDMKVVEKQYKAYEQKYGELITWSQKYPKNEDLYEMHFSRTNIHDQKTADQADKEMKQLIKLRDDTEHQYRCELFKILRNNIRKWWD